MQRDGALREVGADSGAGAASGVPPRPALQRSSGTCRIGFKRRGRESVLDELYQEGCLKARLPRAGVRLPEAVIINTAGGLTGGDRMRVSAHWRAHTMACITTQACERIYRSQQGDAAVENALVVETGATGLWLPQETILFDGGRLARQANVELAAGARLIACEAAVMGRTAMDETVREGAFRDGWTIRRDGRLVFCDRIALSGDIQETLARPAVGAGGRGFATVLHAGTGSDVVCAALKSLIAGLPVTGGCSDLGDVMVARIVAADGQRLRTALIAVLDHIVKLAGGSGLPRVWTI